MLGLANFIAGQEWIFIIVIAVVLIFGAKKIPELAKTFGKAKGEFEKGKIEADKELNNAYQKNQWLSNRSTGTPSCFSEKYLAMAKSSQSPPRAKNSPGPAQ